MASRMGGRAGRMAVRPVDGGVQAPRMDVAAVRGRVPTRRVVVGSGGAAVLPGGVSDRPAGRGPARARRGRRGGTGLGLRDAAVLAGIFTGPVLGRRRADLGGGADGDRADGAGDEEQTDEHAPRWSNRRCRPFSRQCRRLARRVQAKIGGPPQASS
jgi:hypothetical protein